jgi:hypothetical protein
MDGYVLSNLATRASLKRLLITKSRCSHPCCQETAIFARQFRHVQLFSRLSFKFCRSASSRSSLSEVMCRTARHPLRPNCLPVASSTRHGLTECSVLPRSAQPLHFDDQADAALLEP